MTKPPTISEHMKNLSIQENTRFKIVGGTGYYIVDGQPVPREEFEKQHPVNIEFLKNGREWKGTNPDKTRII